MSNNKVSRHRRRSHVVLIRHCVRSTESIVDLYDGKGMQNVSNFLLRSAQLPAWNTPQKWCTEAGTRQMHATGEYLLRELLLHDADPIIALKIRIVSDTAQRDVDTSLALAEGIRNAAAKYNVVGLNSLEYAPSLFRPLASDEATAAVCNVSYSPEQLQQEIQVRLSTVNQPELSLDAAAKLLKMGKEGSQLRSVNDTADFRLILDSKNETRLVGIVNVVKLAAEMLFYSRASGITPLFLPEISDKKVYQLLQWVHWTRSVLDVGTVRAAVEGAALARAVLDSLEREDDDVVDDGHDRVTVIVGHDGDLDALATALGVAWELLGPPYSEPRDLYATPPGSAMYLRRDEDETVKLLYMYPDFALDAKAGVQLQMIPLQLVGESGDEGKQSVINLTDLRSRVSSILLRHPGATECFDNAGGILSQSGPSKSQALSSSWSSSEQVCHWTEVALGGSLLLVAILLLWMSYRQYCKASSKYDVVARQVAIELV